MVMFGVFVVMFLWWFFVVWCSTGVVPEWCSCCGVFLVLWCSTGVVLEWWVVFLWWCGVVVE